MCKVNSNCPTDLTWQAFCEYLNYEIKFIVERYPGLTMPKYIPLLKASKLKEFDITNLEHTLDMYIVQGFLSLKNVRIAHKCRYWPT